MASSSAAVPATTTTPDSLITVKVAIDGSNRRFKVPLRELNASTLPDKLRSLLQVPSNQQLQLERFSDSSSAYIALDPENPATYKQLYRAAKAKLKLRIKATVVRAEAEFDEPTLQPKAEPKDEVDAGARDTIEPHAFVEPLPQPVKSEATGTPLAAQFNEPIEPYNPRQAKKVCQPPVHSGGPFQDHRAVRSTEGAICQRLKDASFLPSYAFQVSCDGCNKTVVDAHFHCSICEGGDYDLCEPCVDAGKVCPGDGHWMIKRHIKNGKIVSNNTERQVRKPRSTATETEPKVPGAFEPEAKPQEADVVRTCNACVRVLPKKLLVTCTDCDDFDLCTPCHIAGKTGHHPAHTFKPIVEDSAVSEQVKNLCRPGRDVRHNAVCDGCDKTIFGVRHKCLDCPDWDYCNICVLDAPRMHSEHRFVPIYEPLGVPQRISDMANNFHFGIYCDGPLCKGKPNQCYIRGVRYKCAICHDTDFCAVCEAHPSNEHNSTHPLIKFKTQVKHVSVSTIGEDAHGSALPVMGDQKAAAAPSTAQRSAATASNDALPPYAPECTANTSPLLQSIPSIDNANSPPSTGLDARFMRDLVKDGTVYRPNALFRQVWTVRNPGPQPWPAGCSVRRVGGDDMMDIQRSQPASVSELASAAESNSTPRIVPPGASFNFSVSMRAPPREGKHISYWRLKTPQGVAFGHKLWCDVDVKLPVLPEAFAGPPPAYRTMFPGGSGPGVPHPHHSFRQGRRLPPIPGLGPIPGAPTSMAAAASRGGALADYQLQLQLLEQQNQRRLRVARGENTTARQATSDVQPVGGVMAPLEPMPPVTQDAKRDADLMFADINSQLNRLEEQNSRRLELSRQQQQTQTLGASPIDLVQRFKQQPMPAHPEVDAASSISPTATPHWVEPATQDYAPPHVMSTRDRVSATAAAAAAASAAAANMKKEYGTYMTSQSKTQEASELSAEEELQTSAMVFPKLEKESPASSTHLEVESAATAPSPAAPASQNETATETETVTSAAEEDRLERMVAEVEFDEASDEGDDEDDDDAGFLTDEEYDILDASDEEIVNQGKSGI